VITLPAGYAVSTDIYVRYAETDQMGVVYYGNYFTWFEVGRNAFFRSLGQSYKALEEQGMLLPIVEAYCRYLNPAKFEDRITITTSLDDLTASRLVFSYTIRCGETPVATGRTTQCFVLKKSGRPVSLKKHHPDYWQLLQELLSTRDNKTS
jgi:acyl-CoA thioester hydrolase